MAGFFFNLYNNNRLIKYSNCNQNKDYFFHFQTPVFLIKQKPSFS